jgi:GNAT superfamily N-acetyltransferase
MDMVYRPAQSEDLEPGSRILQGAILDLRQRHGIALPQPLGPPAFGHFCLGEDPSGLWVAEADGEVIGWTMSWMCGHFWFLSQLFVRPDHQGRGIGQALLDRTLAQAGQRGAENRALITFAYNRHSTGLYVRNGMYPRVPLYCIAAAATALPAGLCDAGHTAEDIELAAGVPDWFGDIDEAVLGFRRDKQHHFLADSTGARRFRITRSGQIAGYAYATANGLLGPLAVAPGEDPAAVVGAALRRTVETIRPEQIMMFIPGPAERMLSAVSKLGFRIEETLVVLSAKPFGDWRNYAPSNPGYM